MEELLRKTSRLSLVAMSALLLGAGMSGAAQAADLKGGAFAGDLEERVAELEATAARKGNRVVSLEISGQVNRALLFWDDGVDSDTYVVDPDSDGSRFRFTGKASLKPGWTAGYTMELTVVDTASNQVFNGDNGDDPIADIPRIRRNFVYVESDKLGRLSIGQENQATDGINEIGVVTTYSTVSKTHYAGAFELRGEGGGFSGVLWQDILGAVGGTQEDIVKYDTPSIYGFILSASWGDDDVYDVALRFQKEWNSVKIAAGIGYLKDDREDSIVDDQVSGSISAQHVPSGLFLTFAAADRDQKGTDENATNLYVQGGISKKWLPYGDTTFWADYAKFEGFSEGLVTSGGIGAPVALSSSEASVWGFGVVQAFDSAAMNIYALAQFYEADLESGGIGLETEDHFAVVVGSHIKF